MSEETAGSPVPPAGSPVCYRHPDRETRVACVRCDRPICPDCMRSASVGFQCPECVNEGRTTTRLPRTAFGGDLSGERGTVTKALLGINSVAWVFTVLAALVTGDVVPADAAKFIVFGGVTGVTEWGAAVPALLAQGGLEYHRLLTADFLHYGLIHLAFNMYALWILGRECERYLGRWRFLALYLLAGIGGSVGVYLFSAPGAFSAGASASIFGLLGAMFFFLRKMRADPRGLIFLIVLNFSLGFVVTNISIYGHLGGLVVGALVGAILSYVPTPRTGRPLVQIGALVATALILAAVVIVRTAQYTPLG